MEQEEAQQLVTPNQRKKVISKTSHDSRQPKESRALPNEHSAFFRDFSTKPDDPSLQTPFGGVQSTKTLHPLDNTKQEQLPDSASVEPKNQSLQSPQGLQNSTEIIMNRQDTQQFSTENSLPDQRQLTSPQIAIQESNFTSRAGTNYKRKRVAASMFFEMGVNVKQRNPQESGALDQYYSLNLAHQTPELRSLASRNCNNRIQQRIPSQKDMGLMNLSSPRTPENERPQQDKNPLLTAVKRREFDRILESFGEDQQLQVIMVKLWDLSKLCLEMNRTNLQFCNAPLRANDKETLDLLLACISLGILKVLSTALSIVPQLFQANDKYYTFEIFKRAVLTLFGVNLFKLTVMEQALILTQRQAYSVDNILRKVYRYLVDKDKDSKSIRIKSIKQLVKVIPGGYKHQVQLIRSTFKHARFEQQLHFNRDFSITQKLIKEQKDCARVQSKYRTQQSAEGISRHKRQIFDRPLIVPQPVNKSSIKTFNFSRDFRDLQEPIQLPTSHASHTRNINPAFSNKQRNFQISVEDQKHQQQSFTTVKVSNHPKALLDLQNSIHNKDQDQFQTFSPKNLRQSLSGKKQPFTKQSEHRRQRSFKQDKPVVLPLSRDQSLFKEGNLTNYQLLYKNQKENDSIKSPTQYYAKRYLQDKSGTLYYNDSIANQQISGALAIQQSDNKQIWIKGKQHISGNYTISRLNTSDQLNKRRKATLRQGGRPKTYTFNNTFLRGLVKQ